MKKKIYTILIALLAIAINVQAQVVLNEENFPDANFRAALATELGISEGETITQEKINATTLLRVASKNISDLKGIEHFTALTSLHCQQNQLTTLNVSGCTALTSLYCQQNQLTTLDVSNNKALNKLDSKYNQLTTLNVSGCTALTSLDCNSNQLTILDVSTCKALKSLSCSKNQLITLDVSKNTKLTDLYVRECTALTKLLCSSNKLTTLDVSGCTALTTLLCNNNQLTTLNVSTCTALTELKCSSNKLTRLLVFNNTALTTLDCSNNQLTALNLSNNTALDSLVCHHNQLTVLDLFTNTTLTMLDCSYNQLTFLDVSACTALKSLYCYINKLPTLDVSGCTALTELLCDVNELTALDVSKNIALTNLDCNSNQLTALNLSNNTALDSLSCYGNQLTVLDVSNNTALIYLYCGNNQLTSLDVSKNIALFALYCYDNQLTSLDVSNTSLRILFCYNNRIKGAMMDALVTSLPTVTSGLFYVIDTQDENEGNVCTKTQVNAAKTKGWSVYDYNKGKYEGSDELILNEDNFTDSNFRSTLSEILGINEDDEITPDMIDAVTALNVSNKIISNLKGIEHFTELETLYCQLNQIKDADMDALIAGLPTRNVNESSPRLVAPRKANNTWGSLYAYDNTTGNEGNVITTEQVADANAKGWKVYQYNGTAWEEYTGTSTGITNLSNDDDIIGTWYTLDGKRLNDKPQKAGIYIVKMSNGTMKKVAVK